jgi:hypothetical protein
VAGLSRYTDFMKVLLSGIVILLVFAGAYLLVKERAAAPVREEATQTASSTEPAFTWRLSYHESNDENPPRTDVALIAGTDVYDIGSYPGSCSEIAPAQRLEGEVSAVLCWWAGGGDELGVFKENGKYVVKLGAQDEPTDESQGFRGDFKQLLVLE